MSTSAIGKSLGMTLAMLSLCAAPPLRAGDLDAVNGPNVRVMRFEDGRKSVFTRSPDQRVVTKKTFAANGRLALVTVYRLAPNGNPLASQIFDGQKNLLYEVDYGYRKEDGQLVMERMWDRRVRRVWKNNPTEEMPVQVVEYLIDSQGRASKPKVSTYLDGKNFERDYGSVSSAMDPKMFDEKAPGIPAGKPAGTR